MNIKVLCQPQKVCILHNYEFKYFLIAEQAPTRKKEVKNVASHYFKTEEINVRDFFGNRPVKRDNSRNIIKVSDME